MISVPNYWSTYWSNTEVRSAQKWYQKWYCRSFTSVQGVGPRPQNVTPTAPTLTLPREPILSALHRGMANFGLPKMDPFSEGGREGGGRLRPPGGSRQHLVDILASPNGASVRAPLGPTNRPPGATNLQNQYQLYIKSIPNQYKIKTKSIQNQ